MILKYIFFVFMDNFLYFYGIFDNQTRKKSQPFSISIKKKKTIFLVFQGERQGLLRLQWVYIIRYWQIFSH